jgi:integrase
LAHEIHKVRVRTALKPRKEPYWGPSVADDLAVGFRKVDDATGYWIARWRVADPLPGQRRYEEDPLGLVTAENDYEVARTAALKWRQNKVAGVSTDGFTLADACREYVEDRRREKGEGTAHDADKRFERTIYEKPIGATQLAKIRTPTIRKWRDGLGLSKPSTDRTVASVKAAIHLAISNRRVSPGVAQEWADVTPYGARAGKRRDLYLDLEQRKALLKATTGAIGDLMEGVALTGARPGELVNALRSQFDKRTGTMTFIGKTGRRDVPLSPAAIELFTRLAHSKLPTARLFVRDDGKPWAHSDWDELVRAAADAAQIEQPDDKPPKKLPKGVCLYTLRHSFITQAITSGMTTLDVARLVGTSVVMIEKHYGHLVASAARERLAGVVML